jgi:hypothetical protein
MEIKRPGGAQHQGVMNLDTTIGNMLKTCLDGEAWFTESDRQRINQIKT